MRLEIRERVGQPRRVLCPRSGQHFGERLCREAVHADAVGGEPRHPGDRQAGRHGVVELAPVAETRRHQTSSVDRDDDLLRPLDFVGGDHRLAAARRRLPVDRAETVVGTILAQTRELTARTAPAQPPQPGLEELRAGDQIAAAVERGEVGRHPQIDRHGVRAAPLHDSERRADAGVVRAQRGAPALARDDADLHADARARRNDGPHLSRVDREPGGRRFDQRDRARHAPAVANIVRERIAPRERKTRRFSPHDLRQIAQQGEVESDERHEREHAGRGCRRPWFHPRQRVG